MPLDPLFQTLLVIGDVHIPVGAGRGIKESISLIPQATQIRRTVNGDLVNIGVPMFRKYKATITCTDMALPTLQDVYPGDIVECEFSSEWSYPSGGAPLRPPASGSEREALDGTTFYRPTMTMMVSTYSMDFDEWQAASGWSLVLEEM